MNATPTIFLAEPTTRNRAQDFRTEDEDRTPSLLNWNAVAGAMLVLGVGASFWTGLGLTIARVWK